jgi:hypothetical protein
MPSRIKKEEALAHINHYRAELPASSLKSVWLNRDIIDFIVKNADTLNISGLRVYLAKYQRDVIPASLDEALADQQTMVVAPTTTIDNLEVDLEAYFDYALPCPQHCNGDAGN